MGLIELEEVTMYRLTVRGTTLYLTPDELAALRIQIDAEAAARAVIAIKKIRSSESPRTT